ncbi:proline iminopeptidase [Bombiscardovia apis]|uniref:Proline iminopeptidase n=1 Tax=Bombiscardovia apis TaxID=2932182 RepID=A0ABM8BCL4_9BIFI|nr:alpha/beta fold hydrolase [Bombiscardovia apis]BDR54431.1 proline iminopeptidase [Bombiscardovia apis]
MTRLNSYFMPGLYVEDHSISVPLDWSDAQPGGYMGQSETISLFYRVMCAPERVHDDLPLLLFLQGGPGGTSPRPITPSSDAWIGEAIKHFRLVIPDQRGTGRSSLIDGASFERIGSPSQQAQYLRCFLADSIVRDFEHLRLTQYPGQRWVSLGQSYGGFLTLTYLSAFPQALAASFTTGGIPPVPIDPRRVYERTFPRMRAKNREFYERYPQDMERVNAIADRLSQGDVVLPNGDPLTVERFQTLGHSFGMKPSFERLHWLLDTAFQGSDGSVPVHGSVQLSQPFLVGVEQATTYSPLYWPLQEFVYADGNRGPIRWAGQQVRDQNPDFATVSRPLLFTGEVIFPWMFEQERNLRPFRDAVNLLMEEERWPQIFDCAQLSRNQVPLHSAVYYNDMYVDFDLQMETLSHVGNAHAWVTSDYEHDGIHEGGVFPHLFTSALERGDLADLL